jgi:hypothetical protein
MKITTSLTFSSPENAQTRELRQDFSKIPEHFYHLVQVGDVFCCESGPPAFQVEQRSWIPHEAGLSLILDLRVLSGKATS